MAAICAFVITMASHGTDGKKAGRRDRVDDLRQRLELVTLATVALLIFGCSGVPGTFAPTRPLPPNEVSHKAFHEVLQAHVREGQVDYPAIQASEPFRRYLDQLDHVDPGLLSREARLAFWINAYNAFAIQGILDGLTPAPYLGWYRFFKGRTYRVGGQRLTLSDLEHEILRPQFGDPRVHFAIVCASASCPRLQSWAFEAEQIDRQLDHVARAFINDPTRNRFDRESKTARLSMIFKWFEEDFAHAAGSVQAYLARYVDDADVARDLSGSDFHIEYLDYDWSLNGPAPKG
jgi:hypothetical protein